MKQALFNAAVAESRRVRDAGGDLATVPLWNKLVFAKVGPDAPLEIILRPLFLIGPIS